MVTTQSPHSTQTKLNGERYYRNEISDQQQQDKLPPIIFRTGPTFSYTPKPWNRQIKVSSNNNGKLSDRRRRIGYKYLIETNTDHKIDYGTYSRKQNYSRHTLAI